MSAIFLYVDLKKYQLSSNHFFLNSLIDFQKRASKITITKLQMKSQVTRLETTNAKLQITDHKLQNTIATALRTNSNKHLHVPYE